MHVLVMYGVLEHISELMAEAEAERLARTAKPKRRSLRMIVTSLFSARGPVAAPAAS